MYTVQSSGTLCALITGAKMFCYTWVWLWSCAFLQEAYFRYMAENPTAGVVQEEEEDNLEYDSDGNPIAPSKKIIDPLPPIDHSEVWYCWIWLFFQVDAVFSFKLMQFSSALIFRFSQYQSTPLIRTPHYVMRIFLWNFVVFAKWLNQKVTEWLRLCSLYYSRYSWVSCSRSVLSEKLYSSNCTCFPYHHLPSSFNCGSLDLHLLFNCYKSLLFLPDLGQMKGCS